MPGVQTSNPAYRDRIGISALRIGFVCTSSNRPVAAGRKQKSAMAAQGVCSATTLRHDISDLMGAFYDGDTALPQRIQPSWRADGQSECLSRAVHERRECDLFDNLELGAQLSTKCPAGHRPGPKCRIRQGGGIWWTFPRNRSTIAWVGGRDGTKLMTGRHESAEDRSAVALRLFAALCAQYPDKYIALIQPRDSTNGAQIPGSLPAELEVKRARNP
jgi:hypothetical protein